MNLQEMPEEITEDYLLTRAQEVINSANSFLHIFDRFNHAVAAVSVIQDASPEVRDLGIRG